MKNGFPEIEDIKNFRCEPATDDFWGFEASGEWDGIKYFGVASTKEEAGISLLYFASEKLRRKYARQNTDEILRGLVGKGIITEKEYKERMIMQYGNE